MDVQIFHVEGGFFAYVVSDAQEGILINCGVDRSTGLSPSKWLSEKGVHHIRRFILSTYDRHLLADFENLRGLLRGSRVHRNRSVPDSWLESRDFGAALLRSLREGIILADCVESSAQVDDVEFRFFHNDYQQFENSADLSTVVFVSSGDLHIIFPGELEARGWRSLLANEQFRGCLRRVNVFVVSSLGSPRGYCAEVFEVCEPSLIVAPDTLCAPDVERLYTAHAAGLGWSNGEYRYIAGIVRGSSLRIVQEAGSAPRVFMRPETR